MNLNIDEIATGMITAAKDVFDDKWPIVQKYAESEARLYAQRMESVTQMLADGIITQERAWQHVAMQNNAWETTLLAVEGMTLIMIEAALNAAIKVIRNAVNTAAKLALL